MFNIENEFGPFFFATLDTYKYSKPKQTFYEIQLNNRQNIHYKLREHNVKLIIDNLNFITKFFVIDADENNKNKSDDNNYRFEIEIYKHFPDIIILTDQIQKNINKESYKNLIIDT